MGYILLGSLRYSGEIIGFRLLDKASESIVDMDINTVRLEMAKQPIEGLDWQGNTFVGTNGSLERYTNARYVDGFGYIALGKSPVVVLREMPDKIYCVANFSGEVSYMKSDDLVMYAESEGLANGKVVHTDSGDYISSIKGEFEKDKQFQSLEYGSKLRAKMALLRVNSYSLTQNSMAFFDRNGEAETDTLQIGRGCLGICDSGFQGYPAKKIVLPSTCVLFGKKAFADCKQLTSINIPEGTQTLPQGIFEGCRMLKEISLPNSLVRIEANAFYNSGIKTIYTGPKRIQVDLRAVPPGVKIRPRR